MDENSKMPAWLLFLFVSLCLAIISASFFMQVPSQIIEGNPDKAGDKIFHGVMVFFSAIIFLSTTLLLLIKEMLKRKVEELVNKIKDINTEKEG